jgi:tRNA (guanine26-N2/guanine27-N2)-dimethyltransferase
LEYVKIKEGRTNFLIPEQSRQTIKGPYRARGTGVFYNPQMLTARDITIAVVEKYFDSASFKNKNLKFLDGLAGTGIRGLRLSNELSFSDKCMITLNDGNPVAVELITRNVKSNGLEQYTNIQNQNLNTLLSSSKYHFIDIDPFGSAVNFIDNAVRAVKPGGLLAITSTDTAPLCGTYPKTCIRRYGAVSKKTEYMHEAGLRILMGALVRSAAKYDLVITPVLLYNMDYYFRLFVKVTKGARAADVMLGDMGCIAHNDLTGERIIVKDPVPGPDSDIIGPLWCGPLNDKAFVKTLSDNIDDLKSIAMLKKNRQIWYDESEMPPWYYDTNIVASKLKTQPKKIQEIARRLERHDFSVVKTHFSPQGFKTDAKMSDLKLILK